MAFGVLSNTATLHLFPQVTVHEVSELNNMADKNLFIVFEVSMYEALKLQFWMHTYMYVCVCVYACVL